jgi:hypothetical protein
MSKRIIVDGAKFPIQPNHIHISEGFEHLWDAFGNTETEVSAYYVVKLCQRLGGWLPFTEKQIEMLYRESKHIGFTFNSLVRHDGSGWIVLDAEGNYRVTDDFVTRCFKSSPVESGSVATSS